MSPARSCWDHTICPVSSDRASTASLVPVAGAEWLSPVPTFKTRRLASMVGDAQIDAPRSPELRADVVPTLWLCFRDGVGRPDRGPGRRIERHHRGAAFAALIFRVHCRAVVAARDRHKEPPLE
jgi:hypothetical protein